MDEIIMFIVAASLDGVFADVDGSNGGARLTGLPTFCVVDNSTTLVKKFYTEVVKLYKAFEGGKCSVEGMKVSTKHIKEKLPF
jgi:hypothetical protein